MWILEKSVIFTRLIPYRRTPESTSHLVKLISMSNDELHNDAVTLLSLLRHNEDSLNDVGKQLVKHNKMYARNVFMHEVDGWTPFHAFVLRGARKMVKLCLKAGVDVNVTMGASDGLPKGCSALHLAAHRGDVSIIDLLLSNGARVNVKDKLGRAPVIYASQANNSLAVKHLKRAGADMTGCKTEKNTSDETSSSNVVCFLPFACTGVRR